MVNFCEIETPIGRLVIEEDGEAITALYKKEGQKIFSDCTENDEGNKKTELLQKAGEQLREYFVGERKYFDLPLHLHGTAFQQKVWNALRQIPYGETCSYGELAARIGNSKASRAVGGANNRNPIMIIVPCHRVIGANGALVGFGCGLPVKEYLLALEKGTIKRI